MLILRTLEINFKPIGMVKDKAKAIYQATGTANFLDIINSLGMEASTLLTTLLSNSLQGVILLKNKRFMYLNQFALNFLEISNKVDVLKMEIDQFVDERSYEELNKLFDNFKSEDLQPAVLSFNTSNGKKKAGQVKFIPLNSHGSIFYLVIIHDVNLLENLKTEIRSKDKILAETERLSKIGSYKIELAGDEITWTRGLYNILELDYNQPEPTIEQYQSFVHPDDRKIWNNMFLGCVKESKPFDLIYRIVLRNKKQKVIHSMGTVITEVDQKRYLFGFFRDVTSEIEKDKIINENKNNLNILFDTIQEGLALNEAIYDNNGNIIDYRIIMVNSAFDIHSNTTSRQALGKLATEAYGMDSEYIKNWWISLKNTVFPVHTEYQMPNSNKCVLVSTSNIVNEKFVTAFFDITEQKTQQAIIEKSEKKYKDLVENANIAIFQIIDGNIAFANLETCKLFGYAELDDLISMPVLNFVHKDYKNKFTRIINSNADIILRKDSIFQIDIINRKKQLKKTEMVFMKIDDGLDNCWQIMVVDITQKLEIQTQSKQLFADALYVSQKLKILNQIETKIKIIMNQHHIKAEIFSDIFEIIGKEEKAEKWWNIFKRSFNLIYIDFFEKLLAKAPDLTQQELKHCAFIKMNFETKEIALMFNVKPTSIQIARVRLKKKFKLNADQDLFKFILTI